MAHENHNWRHKRTNSRNFIIIIVILVVVVGARATRRKKYKIIPCTSKACLRLYFVIIKKTSRAKKTIKYSGNKWILKLRLCMCCGSCEPAATRIKYVYEWYANNNSGNNSRITTNESGLVSEQARDGINVATKARTARQIHKRIIGKGKATKHLWEHQNSFARLRTRTKAYAQPASQPAKKRKRHTHLNKVRQTRK